ncbi:MAG: TolC family protein [Bacteroidetes bacterium]|nr:TolC family protein [Bacteroidota bacterium]
MRAALCAAFVATLFAPSAFAQQTGASQASSSTASAASSGFVFAPGLPRDLPGSGPVEITLDEALRMAREQSIALRSARLDVETVQAQIEEARAGTRPNIALSSSYTRNFVSSNPFAGSSAGGLFATLGFLDWVAYNERARTDNNPATNPISLVAYQDSVSAGYQQAGISVSSSDNPFSVPNQFQTFLAVTQPLYSRTAGIALKAVSRLESVQNDALQRASEQLDEQVRQQFYAALLAEAQADVVRQSLARTRESVAEISRRVDAGVLPRFQRLSAEVQEGNLATQLVQAENYAALAKENLKITLGLPADRSLVLQADFDATTALAGVDGLAVEPLVTEALERRADVRQARTAVDIQDIQRQLTASAQYPNLSAFLNLGMVGNVPDDRTVTEAAPGGQPFTYQQRDRGFFSGDFWQPSVSGGLRLNWQLYDGNRTSAQVQQRRIAVEQARLNVARAEQGVRLQVQQALLTVQGAQQRVLTQQQNVTRAEENYRIAQTRLEEGVTSALELRDASSQLDAARLSYTQAIHDLLVARAALATAVGAPLQSP